MCAICGFTITRMAEAEVRELLQRMNRTMKYRGPDDEGEWFDSNMALGHRRLSIIDLSPAGHQPMFLPDAGAAISYNGEIYNFLDIRRELENRGRKFRSRTDTEVILHAYAEWGDGFLQKLNGMFAFAIWDTQKKRLLLARDRMGKKPLFYYHNGRRFIFASEMKAILLHPDVPRDIDSEALGFYLNYGYIPAPWTIFKHIRKLRPAHFLIFQKGQIEEKPYWQIPAFHETPEDTDENDWLEQFESILQDAVRIRLISDVPLGAFLSGGVDSSAVVTMMSRVADSPPKTFTIDFSQKEFSEAEDAACVAGVLKTDHTAMQVTMKGLQLLPQLVWHFDEPFGDSSAIPTFYVSRMAREHVTVILSGDGGDELFAGYMNYLRSQKYNWLLALPHSIRAHTLAPISRILPVGAPAKNTLYYLGKARKGLGAQELGVFPYITENLISDDFRSTFCTDGRLWQVLPEWRNMNGMNGVSRLQYIDARVYLPDDILVKVDRMSMANSLETRAPLLDYRLVEFAARVPRSLKLQNGQGKILLKKWLSRYLPKNIVYKRKHGFAVPIRDWFRNPQNGFTHELLLSQRFRKRGYFKPRVVEKILRLHEAGRQDYSTWIWLLLNLELWFQTFMDSDTRKI